MKEMYFFKIVISDLFDFATDPEGEQMTLLQFAKELKKGESEIKYIQQIIDEAHNYREIKRKSGEKGGKAKASSAKAKASSAKAVLKQSLADPYPKTKTKTKTKTETETKKRSKKDCPLFSSTFWPSYPRKEGKEAAQRAWGKLTEDEKIAAIDALPLHKKCDQWQEPCYIPHPSTWLNQKRFNDQLPPPSPPKKRIPTREEIIAENGWM